MTTISKAESVKLKMRLKKLAQDKSNLQLIIQMMNRMSAVAGLDHTIENMLSVVGEIIGGVNLILYYMIEDDVYYADICGVRKQLPSIEDGLVKKVIATREPIEYQHEFSDTRMATPEFSKAYTWIVPLLVGNDLIGVFKMESLHLQMRELARQLPTFFGYVALVLKNEILRNSRLQEAYDALVKEVKVRQRTEKELHSAKEALEEKIVVRTADLRMANEQLEENQKQITALLAKSEQSRRALLSILEDEKRAERAWQESEAKTRGILDNIGIGVALISPKMEILELNHRMREWHPDVAPARHPLCYRVFNDPPLEAVCDYCPTYKTLRDGMIHEAMTQRSRLEVVRNYRIVSSPVLNALGEVTAAILMVEDITEHLSLESQLRQSQKMEAIGRLAGGVAHDFNNMLGVILGHTDLALGQLDSSQPLFAHLQEIRKATKRSADLTRQLLAFARKQTVTQRVLDLNETVEGMLKMLRRLIGEDIDLAWLPSEKAWPVKMDPSQIDQILANLCVNARDAIAGVGKVTIETGNRVFDEDYCANHPGFVPGEYVLLAVTDDGCGMSKDILDKLFEPFFTTKEMGKGTGLGLATIYGIVKQNEGFINVYSELGCGTTFKIYLPRSADKTEPMQVESPAAPIARGHETILLVEDEAAMLDMTRLTLEGLGYRVLAASTPGEAIRVMAEHAGEIRLVITDVVMPEMNGQDLAKILISIRPGLGCLFMSGYTGEVLAHRGVLEEGINHIQKPFSVQDLAAKVRETLDNK
ncbi:MAG: ATP-binding protein [Thermodesulfobacteriota bacterium]